MEDSEARHDLKIHNMAPLNGIWCNGLTSTTLPVCVCVSLFLWHINQLTGRLPPVPDRRRLSTSSHTHTQTHTPALTLSLRAPPLSWRCVSTTVSSLYSDGWWMFGFSLTGSCSAETPLFFKTFFFCLIHCEVFESPKYGICFLTKHAFIRL